MSKIIENQYGDIYKTPGYMRTAGAIYAGSAAAGLLQAGSLLVTPYLIKNMQKKSQSIDNAHLRNAIQDAYVKSGLADNGVKIIEAQTPNTKTKLLDLMFGKIKFKNIEEFKNDPLRQVLYNEILQNRLYKNTKNEVFKQALEDVAKIKSELYGVMFENGYNAAFLPKGNNIVYNADKLGASVFHEMGHAINKNQSRFWKGMQKLRAPMMIAGSVIPTIALCKRKKVEGEEPKNIVDKTTTFIKNNAGKLTTLAFVPIIAEELKATQRGNKLAKQFLSKDAFKKVKATNRLGAASYIGTAILAGAAATVGSKVRDKIAKPKQIG